jgi:hypothetical protein
MKNCVKHIKPQINIALVLCFIFFGVAACSKNEKSDKYVVKINDAVLTEEQIKSALSYERNYGKSRSEFINNWIEREILSQEAIKKGVAEEDQYKSIVEQSKKELAAAIFINKILEEEKTEPSEDEIKKYFESNKDEFRFIDDAFRLNVVSFSDFDQAIQFRNSAIETSWKNGINMNLGNLSLLSNESAQLNFKYQLQPLSLLRIVSSLQQNEVSAVIEAEPAKFVVVQLIEKFDKNLIPPLELARKEVVDRLTIIKKKEIVKQYIDKLIADHNLEIKRYSE